MPKCYWLHSLESPGDYQLLNSFSECDYRLYDGMYVIFLTARMKTYFLELLFYRFLYNEAISSDVYLIWKVKQKLELHEDSARFFQILKYTWEKKRLK